MTKADEVLVLRALRYLMDVSTNARYATDSKGEILAGIDNSLRRKQEKE